MDFVKQQIAQIQQQLAGLSASQKMLTGTLVAVMVMTLLWWGRYAGEAELVPLLNQSLTLDDISNIKGRLTASNITHKIVGDRIMVPADRRFEALADLGYAQLLPQDIKTGLELIEDKLTPWDDQTKTEKMWNEAKQGTLANIIRRFPGVASATVLIDPSQKRMMSGNVEPKASINIIMKSGQKATKYLVNAAASLVSGAQANLSTSGISVIIDGVRYPVQDNSSNTLLDGTLLEQKQQYENHHADRVREQLAFIQGVMVTVTVDMNIKSLKEQTTTYDEKTSLHKIAETESHTEENESTEGGGGEPGAASNTQMAVGGASGGAGTNSLVEETKERFQLMPGKTETVSSTPAGKETVVAASVAVPRSYFVQIYKSLKGDNKEPDDAVLQPLIDQELIKIRKYVKSCTALANDEAVTVETYMDFGPMFAEAMPQTASASLPFGIGNYGKEIALGALAVMSLFMVSWMVRKSTPAPVIAAAPEIRVPQHLQTGEDVAGEVGEGNAMLQGMELDEDAVQTQQMLDQVSTMVKENPDGAANLVKRWLNR